MKNSFKVFICLIWFFLNVLFPYWIVPESKTLAFSGGLLFFLISSIILFKLDLKPNKTNSQNKKYNKLFITILSIVIILSIYVANSPVIMDYGDEADHISRGLIIRNLFANYIPQVILSTISILIIFLIYIFRKKIFDNFEKISTNIIKHKNLFLIILTIISIISFITIKQILLNSSIFTNLKFLNSITRFNPLSAFILALSMIIGGVNELAARASSIIFFIMGAFYIKKTLKLYYDDFSSNIGALIFLLVPGIFYFSTNAHLDMGVVFFFILCTYYFLNFLKTQKENSLMNFVIATTLGFLYKNPLLLIIPITFTYLFLELTNDFVKKNKLQWKKYKIIARYYWIPLITILVWNLISMFLRWRNYDFNIINFTNITLFTRYFMSIPIQAGFVIFSLFILSLVHLLRNKENYQIKLFSLLAFTIIYIFFTGDNYSTEPIFRFSIYYFPFIVFLISALLAEIKLKKAFGIIVILVLAIQLVPFVQEVKEYAYYPVNDLFEYLSQNPINKVFMPRVDPIRFYVEKYNINNNIIFYGTLNSNETNTEKFYNYLKKNEISYIVLPLTEQYFFEKMKYDGINRIIAKELYISLINENKINLIETFNYKQNELGLYKVK